MKRFEPLTFALPLLLAAACADDKPAADPSSVAGTQTTTAAVPAAATDSPARPSAPTTTSPTDTSRSPAATAAATPTLVAPAGTAADNTGQNKRDRPSTALTPMDQGNNEADLKTTQRIRQALMGDSTLGFNAKNVKIITQGGKVTLRGPVSSDQERATVEAAAKRIAGDTQVDNQIEVKK